MSHQEKMKFKVFILLSEKDNDQGCSEGLLAELEKVLGGEYFLEGESDKVGFFRHSFYNNSGSEIEIDIINFFSVAYQRMRKNYDLFIFGENTDYFTSKMSNKFIAAATNGIPCINIITDFPNGESWVYDDEKKQTIVKKNDESSLLVSELIVAYSKKISIKVNHASYYECEQVSEKIKTLFPQVLVEIKENKELEKSSPMLITIKNDPIETDVVLKFKDKEIIISNDSSGLDDVNSVFVRYRDKISSVFSSFFQQKADNRLLYYPSLFEDHHFTLIDYISRVSSLADFSQKLHPNISYKQSYQNKKKLLNAMGQEVKIKKQSPLFYYAKHLKGSSERDQLEYYEKKVISYLEELYTEGDYVFLDNTSIDEDTALVISEELTSIGITIIPSIYLPCDESIPYSKNKFIESSNLTISCKGCVREAIPPSVVLEINRNNNEVVSFNYPQQFDELIKCIKQETHFHDLVGKKAQQRSKIFISYARDGSFGEHLAAQAHPQLQSAGYTVFRDVTDLYPGDRWDVKLELELASSDIVVLIVSEKACKSEWVHNEISLAKEIGLPIIPVLSEKTLMPLWLRHLQVLDFSEQVEWESLSRAIAIQIGNAVDIAVPSQKTILIPSQKTILLVTANPEASAQLRLSAEIREIEEAKRLSTYRENFNLENKGAVRSRDLRRALLDHNPYILHFSGHGYEQGILLEKEDGAAHPYSPEALCAMIKNFPSIECVLLNACHTAKHAEHLKANSSIKHAIGMNRGISDGAAISFSTAFYDALGSGSSIKSSFDLAKSVLVDDTPEEMETPEIYY